MPYGNKGLHFGHIGGVFVPADCYARFLRDRIGAANVLFVCGTDCYGSPIDEGYRKLRESEAFAGSIADYVQQNHDAQVRTLKAYNISLDIYEGSGLGRSKTVHAQVTADIIHRLYENGHLQAIATAQFFDQQAEAFLNGRQVIGRCPVPGCKSEHAWADECDLGHQYLPRDLIAPISTLSGQPPVMRDVINWYFDLPAFRELLGHHVAQERERPDVRPVLSNTIEEFLVPPIIYVKQEHLQDYQQLATTLPPHVFRAVEKGKQSFELEFARLEERDLARSVLDAQAIRYRTGKALVPFRITGNIEWGVPAPVIEDREGLTVWCWPESLWAPISFTRCWLENAGRDIESLNPGRPASPGATWEDFWCSPDSVVYQFIGQDNIYFYGVAQTAMWSALPQDHEPRPTAAPGELQQSHLIANYHLQFLGKKASSSGSVRPPMADDLLNYYTAEQLRAHFLALGLGLRPASFQPKALNPSAGEKDADPVLKEGQLLTNVFNRLARSCFYSAQKEHDGRMPLGEPAPELVADAHQTILTYEQLMHRVELHAVMQLIGDFIRRANKYWSDGIKAAGEDSVTRRQILLDSFYLLRVATVLMHPIAPHGTEMIVEYLALGAGGLAASATDNAAASAADGAEASTAEGAEAGAAEGAEAGAAPDFFSWEHIFAGYEPFLSPEDLETGGHPLRELPPRCDFFKRHESQF
jgi:methionyl-tRNA synthetase